MSVIETTLIILLKHHMQSKIQGQKAEVLLLRQVYSIPRFLQESLHWCTMKFARPEKLAGWIFPHSTFNYEETWGFGTSSHHCKFWKSPIEGMPGQPDRLTQKSMPCIGLRASETSSRGEANDIHRVAFYRSWGPASSGSRTSEFFWVGSYYQSRV